MAGWQERLVEDVRRHPTAYRVLRAVAVLLALAAAVVVLFPNASAGDPGEWTSRVLVGLPFVAFPLLYAVLVHRLLREATAAAATPSA